MVQVQPVGAPTDLDRRAHLHDVRQPTVLRPVQVGDEGRGRNDDGGQTCCVHPQIPVVTDHDDGRNGAERHHGHGVVADGSADRRIHRRPNHRSEGTAEEHAVRAGEREVLDDPDRHAGHDRGGSGARRGHEKRERPTRQRSNPGTSQDVHREQGPEDVELLLDRQRPRVGEIPPVTVEAEDPHDVGAVEQRERDRDQRLRDRIHREVQKLSLRHDDDDAERDHGTQGRKQPQRAPDPEVLEVDTAGRVEFDDQQRRDEETGQHEEDVDAAVSTAEAAEMGVIPEHE